MIWYVLLGDRKKGKFRRSQHIAISFTFRRVHINVVVLRKVRIVIIDISKPWEVGSMVCDQGTTYIDDDFAFVLQQVSCYSSKPLLIAYMTLCSEVRPIVVHEHIPSL